MGITKRQTHIPSTIRRVVRPSLIAASAFVFATSVPAAAIPAPAGLHESSKLKAISTSVAKKTVQVMCANEDDAWRAQAEAGVLGPTADPSAGMGGLAKPGASTLYLAWSTCDFLLERLRDGHPDLIEVAASILTLVHESVHLRGVREESVTDCTALMLMPSVAVKFFHFKAGSITLSNLMFYARLAHGAKPASYKTLC